jgi:hypothetical protein
MLILIIMKQSIIKYITNNLFNTFIVRYLNKLLLEPYDVKISCTVRGGGNNFKITYLNNQPTES